MVSPRSVSIWNPSKVFLIFYFAGNLREIFSSVEIFMADSIGIIYFIMSHLFNVWMGYSFVKFFVFTNVYFVKKFNYFFKCFSSTIHTQIIHNQMKMFALFFPVIKFFIHYLFIYVCLSFFQPWWCSINNQREIGTEIFRITGKQNINHAVFSIELTVSEMLQWLSVNRDVTKSLLPANFNSPKKTLPPAQIALEGKDMESF